jgi:hypothetical protein
MSAKKYPPLPSFQLHAIESGNAMIEKRIGLEIMEIPKNKFQFCIVMNQNKANKYPNCDVLKLR